MKRKRPGPPPSLPITKRRLQNETCRTYTRARTEPEIEAKTVEDEQNSSESPFYSPTITRRTSLLDKARPFTASLFSKLKRPQDLALNHSRKVILTIVVIILVVFIGSVFFAINKQQDEKTQTAFQAVYPQALKQYNEGESLTELNQNLARDSFHAGPTNS